MRRDERSDLDAWSGLRGMAAVVAASIALAAVGGVLALLMSLLVAGTP